MDAGIMREGTNYIVGMEKRDEGRVEFGLTRLDKIRQERSGREREREILGAEESSRGPRKNVQELF